MGVSTEWLRHLTNDADKQRLRQQLTPANDVIEALTEILQRKLSSVSTTRLSHELYGEAAWPYHQAELNGEEKVLSDILKLLPK